MRISETNSTFRAAELAGYLVVEAWHCGNAGFNSAVKNIARLVRHMQIYSNNTYRLAEIMCERDVSESVLEKNEKQRMEINEKIKDIFGTKCGIYVKYSFDPRIRCKLIIAGKRGDDFAGDGFPIY